MRWRWLDDAATSPSRRAGRSTGTARQPHNTSCTRIVGGRTARVRVQPARERLGHRIIETNAEANALASWDNEGGAAKGAPQKDRDDLTFLDKKEERILRCLGAAVIVQWNDLPTDIQHELFEHAMSMGSLHHTADLKSQIARFLHKHKDQEIG